ncbi:BppU family phage baseplate upper protein [Listeria booriae]|uniref:BppU family phage baseplate upper protein n=1 Tax=Listeria booriae TaxID=1552123 RepID=UPI001626E07A|nr:BppU family phage baseplate upper protein [Listeria booriae]MBC2369382.1 BppU family phage baseplate upper protein [Listeria booriae]
MTDINEVYKDLGTTLEISSLHQSSIDLVGSFSTQDVKTARLIFKLTKDNVAMPLSGLDAHIYLTGTTLKSESKAEINKDTSTVSYVLSNEEIKHYGPVQAELYLRYTNGQTLSVHKFHFTIDQALIDQDVEIIDHVYNASIEELMHEYRDKFDNLEVELNRQLEEVKTELDQTQSLAGTTRQEVESYKALLEANLALKKTGDIATGTINNTSESAYTVSYGYLRHYIGAQPAGTVVRIQIGMATNNWGKYVDVVVGGTEIIGDKEFCIFPISPTTTYATGIAPVGTIWTKSVINGVEKLASNTVNLKSAVESGRSKDIGFLRINGANALTDAVVSVDDFNNVLDFGKNYYIPSGAKNAPLAIGSGTAGTATAYVRSSGSVGQFYYHYNGRMFYRYMLGSTLAPYITSKTDTNGWVEFETTNDAQAKVDAYKKSLNTTTVTLTLKNGFTAQNGSTVGYLAIPLGNRYLIWLKGWVTAATGVLATMPATFLPDESYQTAFVGAQQSSSAANQSNLYLNPTNGNVEVVAIGSTTAAVSLTSIIYITKEVAV